MKFIFNVVAPQMDNCNVESSLNNEGISLRTISFQTLFADPCMALSLFGMRGAEGIHAHTRVENEVTIITLAAAAVDGFKPCVIPLVHGWGSAAVLARLDSPGTYAWGIRE